MSEMSSWTREQKFHIYKPPSTILFNIWKQQPFTAIMIMNYENWALGFFFKAKGLSKQRRQQA